MATTDELKEQTEKYDDDARKAHEALAKQQAADAAAEEARKAADEVSG